MIEASVDTHRQKTEYLPICVRGFRVFDSRKDPWRVFVPRNLHRKGQFELRFDTLSDLARFLADDRSLGIAEYHLDPRQRKILYQKYASVIRKRREKSNGRT